MRTRMTMRTLKWTAMDPENCAMSSPPMSWIEMASSRRTYTSPNAAASIANGASNGSINGMRPAMSMDQLCDLTPKEASLSRGLIALWESLIKKNAENGTVIEAVIKEDERK
ncbi:uncharacterized protein LOC110180174 [Drosophila serrata]|uniref:uncharacterized protein LOC110180174 n=1 Tax=Drosophila serrata TaxID=7274 RepID=UPI000A1D0643|nr:uncharacterized protein LOC110180174 [Drosophila serrata]